MRIFRLVIAVVLIAALAVPVVAQVTPEDLEQARAEVEEAQARANEIAVDLNEAWARQAELEDQISVLEGSIQGARDQLVGADERLAELAVELYMGRTAGENIELIFNTDSNSIEAGSEYLEAVSGTEEAEINQLLTTRAQLEAETEQLAEAEAEETEVAEELEVLSTQVQEELSAAQGSYDQLYQQFLIEEEQRRLEEERRRREEAERRAREEAERRAEEERERQEEEEESTPTTQPPDDGDDGGDEEPPPDDGDDGGDEEPPPDDGDDGGDEEPPPDTEPPPDDDDDGGGSGGSACPVAGPVSFTDTWGAPRSGGRAHQGVDMLGAYGTPLAAAFDGTISRLSSSSLGGITIWFVSDAGDEFYYAHLDSYADISEGMHVAAGTIIGYMGTSGNAPEGTPHLHWEYHPGGGGAVNPTPLASELC